MLAEGGSRRPTVHPELAAWRIVAASLDGAEGVVVGACPACGQPLVGAAGAERAPWTIHLPKGDPITVAADGTLAATTREQADLTIRAAYPTGFVLSDLAPGLALFQGSLLTLMLAPVLLWVLAVLSVFVFLTHFGNPAPSLP